MCFRSNFCLYFRHINTISVSNLGFSFTHVTLSDLWLVHVKWLVHVRRKRCTCLYRLAIKAAVVNPVLNRSMHISHHCILYLAATRELLESCINGISCHWSKTSVYLTFPCISYVEFLSRELSRPFRSR